VTTLRRFMIDVAMNPFLAQQIRANPGEVLDRIDIADEERAAVAQGDPIAIQRILAGQASTIASPQPAATPPNVGVKTLILPEFFSATECALLLDEMIAARRDGPTDQAGLAVSRETTLDTVRRLSDLAPLIAEHFDETVTEIEHPQFLCHRPGDDFPERQDNSDDPHQPAWQERRRLSIVIFVNGPSTEHVSGEHPGYDRGELRLFRTSPDSPYWASTAKSGTLVAFSAKAWHQFAPIHSGERYTIASWLLDRAPDR